MLGVYAEFETNLRRERQAEGISAAKRSSVNRGRPPAIDMDAIRARIAEGRSPTWIAREMAISRGTVWKAKAGMPGKAVRCVFLKISIYAALVRLGLIGVHAMSTRWPEWCSLVLIAIANSAKEQEEAF